MGSKQKLIVLKIAWKDVSGRLIVQDFRGAIRKVVKKLLDVQRGKTIMTYGKGRVRDNKEL